MVKQLLSDSLALVFGHLETVFKVCGAWFVLQFVVSLLILAATGGNVAGTEDMLVSPGVSFLMAVSVAVALASSASISVAWHRFGLLGEEVAAIHLRFGAVEFQFIWRMFLIGFISFAITFLMVFVAFLPGGSPSAISVIILGIGFVIVVVPFLMRLNLVLPAAVIEQPIGFGEALRIGKGLGWRMFLAIVVLSVPFTAVTLGLQWVLTVVSLGLPALLIQIKVMILNVLLQIIVTVLGISVITAGYRMAIARDPSGQQD